MARNTSDHGSHPMDNALPYQIMMGGQMLFVAFGALVLVPLLAGLDANVAFFTAGAGTLLFQIITRRKVPVFLASSFAFIAPISFGVSQWGLPATMGALAIAGLFYLLLSFLVKVRGLGILYLLFPPVVIGPVIMVIGLGLAGTAVDMATGVADLEIDPTSSITLAASALLATLITAVFGKGIFKLVPIMAGVTTGYIFGLLTGQVDLQPMYDAPWFAVPNFTLPEFNINAVLYMLPVAIAPAIEHVGDMMAIGSVTGKNYLKKPGLHKTLLGDGLATSLAACLGGPPNTTYSEVTGAVILTKSYNPAIMTWAALAAIGVAFIGKVGGFLATIPTPVMGGIMVLLFGSIAVIGLNTLIKVQVDVLEPRNLVIVALVLVFGLGGLTVPFFGVELEGISLAGLIAVILNLVLPHTPGEDQYSSKEISGK